MMVYVCLHPRGKLKAFFYTIFGSFSFSMFKKQQNMYIMHLKRFYYTTDSTTSSSSDGLNNIPVLQSKYIENVLLKSAQMCRTTKKLKAKLFI